MPESSDALVVYVLSIAATIATTPFRSSQAALTPTLAQTPEELTAANAVASGIESVAVFAGPALAGVLLALTSTGKAQCADGKCWNTQALLDLQKAPAGKVQVRPGVMLDTAALKSTLSSNMLL